MTSFDYIVLAIIGLSIILSVMRGFFREALSILGWIAAFVVAKTYVNQILPMMPVNIPTESLRILAAFLVLFLATLLVSSLLAIALSAIFKKIGLGWLNRLLGAVFGLARGMLVVCILVFLAGLTDMPKDARWRNAMFSAPIEALVISMLPWMPISIAKHVKYD
ncbi:CvpA family protein [Methylotenera sp.]|uniref:CvpA family protein n=1 Tax=Methylotenera sp. TaxID=2051956 RepID=UPI002725C2C3|nr:CvpA family protein [Methylotenera sp.]MDO9206032.1 CvpA family protein [Methylotenera sp.]MDP2071874.1 CvpA family protein [Methylotenera sp.]MDP2230787.1 CvpA family protein [Methylotenera sp.]MDP3005499.1 CvpA family protein [Methylotenera sp.]MDP3140600.1 CvpA family protein [Methylotenera sp.]